jgi:hypothetical protein
MKKFLIIMLAAFFCLAFALPAMAKVRVGGMITWDFMYRDLSSEAYHAALTGSGVQQGDSTVIDGYNSSHMLLP